MSARGQTSDAAGPLPIGWKTRIDPRNDLPMYYCRASGQTSWARPGTPAGQRTLNPIAEQKGTPPPSRSRPAAPPRVKLEVEVEDVKLLGPGTSDSTDFRPPPNSGCLATASCVVCFALGLVAVGVYLMLMVVVVSFADQRGRSQVTMLIVSFFGVLAFGSAAMCILLLVPRFTGTLGIKYLRYKPQRRLLQQEAWVWSMNLRGNCLVKLVHVVQSLSKVWVKAAQLMALTYDPVTIDELPEVYVQIGSVVLFDTEVLLREQALNASVPGTFVDYGEYSDTIQNSTAAATVTDAVANFAHVTGGPQAYRNKFYFWGSACVLVSVLVTCSQCLGVLEGRWGPTAEKIAVAMLDFFIEFAYIPMYHHMLTALDCTRVRPTDQQLKNAEEAGVALNQTWLWDADPEQECFAGEAFGWQGTPGHLFYFIFGMIAICLMQWPTAFFLMVRPDSHADPNKFKIWDLIRASQAWQQELSDLDIPLLCHSQGNRRGKPFLMRECRATKQQGGSGWLADWLRGEGAVNESRLHKREVAMFKKKLERPANALRHMASEQYSVEWAEIKEVDRDGCCSDQPDNHSIGISAIRLRPRELALAFMLEAAVVTISVLMSANGFVRQNADGTSLFSQDPYDRNMLKLKLFSIASCFGLLCLFYCNPLTLLCGPVACSPYKDAQGTDHRTQLLQMGYPYNWEPLNFARSAVMAICCSFAIAELLSFNHKFPSDDLPPSLQNLSLKPDQAMEWWKWTAFGIVIFYSLAFICRLGVYMGHRRQHRKEQGDDPPTPHDTEAPELPPAPPARVVTFDVESKRKR